MNIDIQVPEVYRLLSDAGADLEDLEDSRAALMAAATRLQEAVAGCSGVDAEVDRLSSDIFRPDATDIMVRCNNAVQGTTQAVSEYVAGDDEMFRNAQQAAASGELRAQVRHGIHQHWAIA